MAAKYPSWEPEYRKRYRACLDKEAARLKSREYYKRHYKRYKAAIQERSRRRYAEDLVFRENMNRRGRLYAAANSDRIRQLRESHKSEHAEYRRINREKHRAYGRNKSALISDNYVREQLSQKSPVSSWEWPQEVVEIKRTYIRIKRELKRIARNQTDPVSQEHSGSS